MDTGRQQPHQRIGQGESGDHDDAEDHDGARRHRARQSPDAAAVPPFQFGHERGYQDGEEHPTGQQLEQEVGDLVGSLVGVTQGGDTKSSRGRDDPDKSENTRHQVPEGDGGRG